MTASRALSRPIVLFAMALLVVNDHVLKAAYPGFVTGKLSDFAGLAFFPLMLAAACEQIGVRRGMTTIVAATVATAIVFTTIKVSPAGAELYRGGLAAVQWPFRALVAVLGGHPIPSVGHAAIVADRTDLVAIIALAVPLAIGHETQPAGLSWATREEPPVSL